MRLGQTSVIHLFSYFTSSLVGFIATVYLARVLGASVLGTYFLAVAVLLWMKVVGIMGVKSAVKKRVSENNDEGEEYRYITAGFLVQIGVFVVISALLIVFREYVNGYVGASVVEFLVPMLFAAVNFAFVSGVLQGQHQVHLSALLSPIDRTFRSTLQVAAVLVGFGLAGLLLGYAVAALLASLVGLGFVSYRFRMPGKRHFRSLFSYAKYSWVGTLKIRSFAAMDTIVLGFFVTSSLIGIYEIAWNLASILIIFSTSIRDTVFPEISERSTDTRSDEVSTLVKYALAYTGLFSLPGLVGSIIIGDLVLQVYGKEFARGMYVLVILVFARLVYAYGNQLLNALNAMDYPNVTFYINGLFITTNIGLNFLLVYFYGWVGAAVATSISATLVLVLGYRELTDIIDVDVPVGEILKQVFSAIVMGVIVYAEQMFLGKSLIYLAVFIPTGVVSYFGLLLIISEDFRNTVSDNLPWQPPFI